MSLSMASLGLIPPYPQDSSLNPHLYNALPHDTFLYNGDSLFANDNILPNKSFFT